MPTLSFLKILLVENNCGDFIPNHSLYILFTHCPKTNYLPHSTTTSPTTIIITITLMTGFVAAFLCSILDPRLHLSPLSGPAQPHLSPTASSAEQRSEREQAVGGAAVAGRGGRKRDTTSTKTTTVLRGSKMSACITENLGADAPMIQKIVDTSMVVWGD